MNEFERFDNIRNRLFKCIDEYMKDDYGHKSYEGKLMLEMPNYFEQDSPIGWGLDLHLYCIGPHRHYRWDCESLEKLNNQFEFFVEMREKEFDDERED